LSDEDIKVYVNDFLEKFSKKLIITLEFFPYCLIKKEFHKNIWKYGYENKFISNDSLMLDNWSESVLQNKKKRKECE
jgi:hypothetical protein